MIRYLLILILLLKQQNNIRKKREICIVNKGINTLNNCSIEEESKGGQARGNIGGFSSIFPVKLSFLVFPRRHLIGIAFTATIYANMYMYIYT